MSDDLHNETLLYFGYVTVLPRRKSISVPVGLVCLACNKHFKPTAQGVVMPWDAEQGIASCAYHLSCLLDQMGMADRA